MYIYININLNELSVTYIHTKHWKFSYSYKLMWALIHFKSKTGRGVLKLYTIPVTNTTTGRDLVARPLFLSSNLELWHCVVSPALC